MQRIIKKILFDLIALVAATNYEFVDTERRIYLHDVPQNRLPTDFDHGLGAQMGLFANARAESTGKNDKFQ